MLSQVSQPVVLHWLGEAFDPQLAGYWGSADVATATDTFVQLIDEHAGKVDGVKVSLLDRPSTRPTCAGGCPPASGSTPATTSTTPS